MVQAGTLRIGDIMLAGSNYGRVKAIYDDTGKKVSEVGAFYPCRVLGLDGAPQAGRKNRDHGTDPEAREVAISAGRSCASKASGPRSTLPWTKSEGAWRLVHSTIECHCQR